MVVPYWVGFCIINMRLFPIIISYLLYWFICGLYGYCFLGNSIVIMLVMNMYYDSGYVWLSSCFYLYKDEKCIYGLMDDNATKVIRKQCLIKHLR